MSEVQARRGGRPSRADAEALGERILEIATERFLGEGYGATSIEAIAQAAGISKRTFYHRFANKADLFAAVVHRIITRVRPPPEVPLVAGATLEAILERLAGLMLQAALAPRTLALHRLLVAESARFPELVGRAAGEGSRQEGIDLIASLLQARLEGATLARADAEFAALQFIQMVIAWPRSQALGDAAPLSAPEAAVWVRQTTRLFLAGCRGLTP